MLIPIVVLGAIALNSVFPYDTGDTTPDILSMNLNARIEDISEIRNLLKIQTTDQRAYRIIVFPIGNPWMKAASLRYGADSIRKKSQSDSVWFLVKGSWHGWAINISEHR
ncbi:MAG: hypothetical protein H7X80_05720 [bacterium]|nr:hypothetical protein [Candidatus Kapabacteria bacterium]